jgi:muramidase (phage lysozyme)
MGSRFVIPFQPCALAGVSVNMNAFLFTAAVSEGTIAAGSSECNGYDCLVGSKPDALSLFVPNGPHPNQEVTLTINGKQVPSTAAGRYQINHPTWTWYLNANGLPLDTPFTPENQDRCAIWLIGMRKARTLVEAGAINAALVACAGIWASFPASQADQHTQQLSTLLAAYSAAGGTTQTA